MSAEKTFYTTEELQEFRVIIEQKLETARKEFKSMQETLRSNEDSDSFNLTEFSSDVADKENIERLMSRQTKFINALERALQRIHNGTYGKCKKTGKLIPRERLLAVPHAETVIEAKD
jgi:RNA polymerase-binding transcription factor DksA